MAIPSGSDWDIIYPELAEMVRIIKEGKEDKNNKLYWANYNLACELDKIEHRAAQYFANKIGYDYYRIRNMNDIEWAMDNAADKQRAADSIFWLTQETELEDDFRNMWWPRHWHQGKDDFIPDTP